MTHLIKAISAYYIKQIISQECVFIGRISKIGASSTQNIRIIWQKHLYVTRSNGFAVTNKHYRYFNACIVKQQSGHSHPLALRILR